MRVRPRQSAASDWARHSAASRLAQRLTQAAVVLVLGASATVLPLATPSAQAQAVPALPAADDCTGATPIVVASDVAAQSDIYSAVTLAGVLEAVDPDSGACIVLAGSRDGATPAAQSTRLSAARSSGYIVGGLTAVPAGKAPPGFVRVAGKDRWATARNVGVMAYRLAKGQRPRSITSSADSRSGTSASADRPALPPSDDCTDATPIVVASDTAAQSDIYSAATLAGVLEAVDTEGTVCIVLAGHRNSTMPASEAARLGAAHSQGYVVGGNRAVALSKAPEIYHRVAGIDRWETARAVGALATATAQPDLNEIPPTSRDILLSAPVDASATTVEAGGVTVSVPPGALNEDARLMIHEPLGRVGTLIGGQPVALEHSQPVQQPITVTWDVSNLSAFQRATLVLVAWDASQGRWLADDTDFEIAGGYLTADIHQWSAWSFISNAGSAFNQTVGEIIGIKVDAPKCSGQLPGWVTQAEDPDESSNSASIRLCYESTGSGMTMKTANNRNISRLLYPTGSIDWAVDEPRYSSIADVIMGSTLGQWLENDDRAFMLPLETRHVQVTRPQESGDHSITFQTDQATIPLVLGDILYSAFEQFEFPFADRHALVQVLSPFLECALSRASQIAGQLSVKELPGRIISAITDCFTSKRIRFDSGIEAADVKFHNVLKGLTNLSKIVSIVELGSRLADSISTSDEVWTVTLRGSSTDQQYRNSSNDDEPTNNGRESFTTHGLISSHIVQGEFGEYVEVRLRGGQDLRLGQWQLRHPTPEGGIYLGGCTIDLPYQKRHYRRDPTSPGIGTILVDGRTFNGWYFDGYLPQFKLRQGTTVVLRARLGNPCIIDYAGDD